MILLHLKGDKNTKLIRGWPAKRQILAMPPLYLSLLHRTLANFLPKARCLPIICVFVYLLLELWNSSGFILFRTFFSHFFSHIFLFCFVFSFGLVDVWQFFYEAMNNNLLIHPHDWPDRDLDQKSCQYCLNAYWRFANRNNRLVSFLKLLV